MRAPVYRNLDAASTLLGLSFPTEVLVVIAGGWAALLLLPPGLAALAGAALYAAVRLASYGRPPLHLQHALLRALRHARSGGRLSARARAAAPRFPFAPHAFRETQPVPTRSTRTGPRWSRR